MLQASGLHIAAREGQLLALYCLVTIHSVDVNMVDRWGRTPLDAAVDSREWACAVLIMSHGGEHRSTANH